MVNTGHPSRACKLCRARRIKCDETKPHCLKCKKSKRQCPGYRDPFEINLRDETQATIRKVKAAAAAQKRAAANSTGTSLQQQQQQQQQQQRQSDDLQDVSSDDSPTNSAHYLPTPPSSSSYSSSCTTITTTGGGGGDGGGGGGGGGGHTRRRSSTLLSDSSWETVSKSAWSSPSSEIAVLQLESASISPAALFSSPVAVDAFGGSPLFDLTTLPLFASSASASVSASSSCSPSASFVTQELPFDFNATWSLPETDLLSAPIRNIANSVTSSFDGSTWGLPRHHHHHHDITPTLHSPSSSSSFGSSSSSWSYATAAASSPPLLAGLQTPLDEQATCFFLSNFVLSLTTSQDRCLFSFILRILQWDNIQDTPFPMAFTAVSLAALAGRPNSRHLLSTSRIYYSTALVQLKEVLRDKDRAKHDTSLAAAILLSFYEGLACEDERMAGWSNHLNGAKALIRLRGKDVIKESSPEGLEMFQLVRSMSIRQYMFGFVGNPAPGEVEWWGQHEISNKSGHVALVLNMKTTLIRAEADALLTAGPKTADKIGKALDLLRRARAIVTELGQWLATCQPTWPRVVSGWVDDVDVPDEQLARAATFAGPVYSFPNVWVAGKHLNTNASRIMLSGIMVRCVQWICAPADPTKTDDYAEAMRIGREEVANVIAGVPYFVSWSGDAATTPYFPCGAPTSPKAYSAITAMYPLLCTGLSPFVTTRQKKWLCGRLRFMAESMGIKQAELFAQFIAKAPTSLAYHESTT